MQWSAQRELRRAVRRFKHCRDPGAARFQNPGAVLFSLLLFFQFGNEWSIAGWLPLFLIRRLGISPADSLLLLALYWAALLVGRIMLAIYPEARQPALLLLGSIRVGADGNDGAVVHQQSVRRA